MAITSVTYNGLSMNDGTVYTTSTIDHTQPFSRNLPTFNLARAHGAVITDSTYNTKTIPHSGTIYGTSQSDIQSKIDAFNATMTGFNANLDIGFAGTTRRYIATPASARAWQDNTANNWARFEVQYTVTQFGTDTSATTLISNVANTTASYAPSVTISGSAPLQPLLITVTVTAATGLTGKTITVTTAAGLALAVKRNWTVGEVLTIDESALLNSNGQPVKVGSTAVDFTGYFPSLAPGSGQVLTFGNDFTTRTLTYNISQIKRWL